MTYEQLTNFVAKLVFRPIRMFEIKNENQNIAGGELMMASTLSKFLSYFYEQATISIFELRVRISFVRVLNCFKNNIPY